MRVVNAGGSSDNRDFAVTARGWGSAHPARVVETLRDTETANPIVLVDEIDKSGGGDRNGRIVGTILTMLEPEACALLRRGPLDECRSLLCELDPHRERCAEAWRTFALPGSVGSRFQADCRVRQPSHRGNSSRVRRPIRSRRRRLAGDRSTRPGCFGRSSGQRRYAQGAHRDDGAGLRNRVEAAVGVVNSVGRDHCSRITCKEVSHLARQRIV